MIGETRHPGEGRDPRPVKARMRTLIEAPAFAGATA
jgi:hypothetical protein